VSSELKINIFAHLIYLISLGSCLEVEILVFCLTTSLEL